MNERLRELMLEAGYAAPEIAGRAQKLTELIVKECTQVVENAVDHRELASTYASKIKQHFGVES